MEIGDRIRQKRIEMGLSQDELAQKVGYSSRSTVAKIEKGTRRPQVEDLKKIAEVLNVDMDWLYNGIVIEVDKKRSIADESHLFDYISKLYGEETAQAVHLFNQLDDFQKGKIIGAMESHITYK